VALSSFRGYRRRRAVVNQQSIIPVPWLFALAARSRGVDASMSPLGGVQRMSLGTILLIILVLFLIGALPTWPYSSGWGYYPGSGLGIILIIVVVLMLTGRI
jgi:hypothetical protein